MGYGDELIGSGLARGARARGKRIAFGDGRRIIWREQCYEIYRNNPNVAHPGSEYDTDIEWMQYYSGHRIYGDFIPAEKRWVFHDFKCPPGDLYFTAHEVAWAGTYLPPRAVVIEPTTKPMGACSGVNKQWPQDRYSAIARILAADGYVPVCFGPTANGFPDIRRIVTPTFRHALALMTMSWLYIGPEGGMHHGAAAVSVDAVVLFGGFNSPRSTGYPWHSNLIGEAATTGYCGHVDPCPHCKAAMESITVDEVVTHARRYLAALEEQPGRIN